MIEQHENEIENQQVINNEQPEKPILSSGAEEVKSPKIDFIQITPESKVISIQPTNRTENLEEQIQKFISSQSQDKKLNSKEKNKLNSFIDENLRKIFSEDFEIKSQNPYYIENCKRELESLENVLKKYNLFTQVIKNKFTSEYYKYKGKFQDKNKDVTVNNNEKVLSSTSTFTRPEPIFKYNPEESKFKMSIKLEKMKEFSEYATKPVMSKAVTERSRFFTSSDVFDYNSSLLNKEGSGEIYDLNVNNYPEIEILVNKDGYKFGTPCSILQFGFSNDLYYAVGCNSVILITNSIFELEEVIVIPENKFPPRNEEEDIDNEMKTQQSEIADLGVKLLFNFDRTFIFSYRNYIGLYDHNLNRKHRRITQIGRHDGLSDACTLDLYKNTLVTVNPLNVIKFWNYKIPKIVKISTPSQNGIYSYTTLKVINLDEYLILSGYNSIRLYNITLDKYIHSLDLEKDTCIAMKPIKKRKPNSELFFITALQSGDAQIYSIDKKEDKCQLTLISQVKKVFSSENFDKIPFLSYFNFILTSNNFIIFNLGKLVKIYYLQFEKIKQNFGSSIGSSSGASSLMNNYQLLPRMIYISNAVFSQEISRTFEIEGNLYVFGEDYFTMRLMVEINDIIYKK